MDAGGGMKDLGTLGGPNSGAHDISDAGQVTGGSTPSPNSVFHDFLWTQADGTACTNEVFGDPIVGTVKECSIK